MKWAIVAIFTNMASARRMSSSKVLSRKNSVSYVIDDGDTFSCNTGLDSCQCFGLDEAVTLEKKIGEGAWGAVFRAKGDKYAVKVQTRKDYEDFSEFKDYPHECNIMQDLADAPGLHVPRCLALCKKGDMDVFVMDLVPSAGDLRGLSKLNFNADAMSNLATTIYGNIVSMLELRINNVDQRDVNILVESDGVAHFIDMGMASREDELFEMCKRGARFSTLKSLQPALGNRKACRLHIDALNMAFASSALLPLPSDSLPAMQSLVHAFCAKPSADIAYTRYWKVEVDEKDRSFKKALLGDEFSDLKKVIEKKDKTWFKIGSEPLNSIKSFRGHAQNYDVLDGAELVAITEPGYHERLAEGPAELAQRSGWGRYDDPPTEKGNVGTFIFLKPNLKLMRDAVHSVVSKSMLEEKQSLLKQLDSCY